MKPVLYFLLAIVPVSVLSQVDEQYLAGCANYLKGDYKMAIQNLSSAIIRNNSSDHLYIKRGSAFLKTNDFESAIEDFEEANLIEPGKADIWLARAYALAGKNEMALNHLENHLNSPYKLSEDSIKKDPSFDRIQESSEWHALWQKEWYNKTEKLIADAEYYIRKNQFDKAILLLDNEIMVDPDNTTLMFLRGKAFLNSGNYAAAAGDYSTIISIDKTLTASYSERGYAYLKSERYKEAINDYTKAIKAEPGDFNFYIKRAEAYAAQGSWEPAIEDVLLYLKYFEDDLNAIYRCGEYNYYAGDYMTALKYFNRNLKEDPNNALYCKARGKTYIQTGTYRYAVSDLSMSLDLNPADHESWMFYGLALIKSGDKEKGCSCLQKSQNMGNPEALKYFIEECK